MERREVYQEIQKRLGMTAEYHTANIRSVDEARRVFAVVRDIAMEGDGSVIE